MKAVLHCRALALSIGLLVGAAAPAVADSVSFVVAVYAATDSTYEVGLASKAPRTIPPGQDSSVVDTGYDPLFDDDWDEGEDSLDRDPFEKTNRVFFKFNRGFHRVLLRPIAQGYRFVVPEPARAGLRRAFLNLNSPSILVNDLLQLRFKDAGETFGRFVLNTTLGLGGIFDAGIEAGWEYHDADFGQTLAWMGVSSGPYLVLPLFGPNTVRDSVGDMVDVLFRPLTYLVGPAPNIVIGSSSSFTEFEAQFEKMTALEKSSVDYYAVMRSAYFQSRAAQLRARNIY